MINHSKRKSILVTSMLWLALCFVSLMFLLEVGQRRAKDAANEFLGPVLGQLSWLDSSFYPLFENTNGKISGLVWVERYTHMFSFGEPIALHVDIQGNVQSVDTETFEQWIGLPKNERIRMQELFLEKMRSEGATEAIP